jgi:hypothetical protein
VWNSTSLKSRKQERQERNKEWARKKDRVIDLKGTNNFSKIKARGFGKK